MPMSFGRHRKGVDAPDEAVPRPVVNESVADELTSLAKKQVTGALELTDKAHGGTATLYLYEGGLYSVLLAGYEPRVGARLVASGAITPASLEAIVGGSGIDAADGPGSGVQAVRAGLLSAETLASVHQEYLLASLGAVLACRKLKSKVRKSDVTDALCTLPLPIDSIVDVIARRYERMASTWASFDGGRAPDTLVLRRTSVSLPSSMRLPELGALAAAVDGRHSLDAIAERSGLTRAEAVHLAGMLIDAGVLEPADEVDADGTRVGLAVPEAFGTAPTPPASGPPVADEPEPEPQPEPEPEPESEPEPEPEPDVQLAAAVVVVALAPEPEPPARVVVPDHVIQLRREMARSEVAELEEAMAEAAVAEREAITQAAAIRARLAEARSTLAELGEETAPSGESAERS